MNQIIHELVINLRRLIDKIGARCRSWPIHTLVMCACLLGWSRVGFAQEHIGAWEIICDKREDKSSCRAVQIKSTPDGKENLLALTILITELNQSPAAILSIPLGGYLAPGIEITIDKRQKFKLLVETCNTSGCHAGFPIQGRVLQALQKGRAASIRIWTTKNKPVVTDLSIDRFQDVIDLLKKRLKS